MTTRRQFLKLLGVGAVALATPSVFAAAVSDEKLDRICRHIGVFARERNLRPEQIIAIDESGRLVFVASVHRAEIDGMFHIADRKLQYQRLPYKVERRYLERADRIFLYIHTGDKQEPHTLWLVFE